MTNLLELGMLEAGVNPGELEQPPQRRHPVVAEVGLVEDEDLLGAEVGEVALQLHEVLATGHVGRAIRSMPYYWLSVLAVLRDP